MCRDGTLLIARALVSGITAEDVKALETRDLALDDPEAQVSTGSNAVVFKGPIITMKGSKFNVAEAMAIQGDTILEVGTEAEIEAAVSGLQTTTRDLGSQCIVPGFIEPHLHLLPTAAVTAPYVVDMWIGSVNTVEDAQNAIKKAAQGLSPKDWVLGFGYDPALIEGHQDLTLSITDCVDVPVYIGNPSGHLAYANTHALNAAGIRTTLEPDPCHPAWCYPADNPYYIKHSCTGNLTGVVLESAAQHVSDYAPKRDAPKIVDRARSILHCWTSKGCTTVFDAGIGLLLGVLEVPILNEIIKPNAPDARRNPRFGGAVAIQAVADVIKDWPKLIPKPPVTIEHLKLYTIKYWLDGSTQGFTAAVNKPYSKNDPFDAKKGIFDYRVDEECLGSPADDDKLLALLKPAVEKGWQVMLHVNGTAAVDQALRVLKRCPKPAMYMHRLEHVTADVTPEQLQEAKAVGAGVSHLTAHVRHWGQAFSNFVFGPDAGGADRAARIDPFADDVAAGLCYSFHSDRFVSPVLPLQYVDTAVTREMVDVNGNILGVLGPDQCISLEEAMCGITVNPAKQLGLDGEIGTLEKGKSADFVVLGADPRAVGGGNLVKACDILETWVRGQVAYDAAQSS